MVVSYDNVHFDCILNVIYLGYILYPLANLTLVMVTDFKLQWEIAIYP